MSDVEKWAGILNGRSYRKEVTDAEAKELEKLGIVVVFGASDDLMEFRGAICDEVSCYGGATAYMTNGGVLTSHEHCECEYCGYKNLKAKALKIIGVWDKDGYSWTYKTDIPHATFDILKGEDKYCRGIVFKLPNP